MSIATRIASPQDVLQWSPNVQQHRPKHSCLNSCALRGMFNLTGGDLWLLVSRDSLVLEGSVKPPRLFASYGEEKARR